MTKREGRIDAPKILLKEEDTQQIDDCDSRNHRLVGNSSVRVVLGTSR